MKFLLSVLSIILPLILMSGCNEETIGSSTDNTRDETGTLEISLWSSWVDAESDIPTYVDNNDYTLASLVKVEGLNQPFYMGDKYGVIRIENVPIGEYVIHPLFMDTSLDITVTVAENQVTSEKIVINNYILQYYAVNSNTQDSDFRKALAIGLNRQNLLESISSDGVPLYGILHPQWHTEGFLTTPEIAESTVMAESLFGNAIGIDLSLIHNTSPGHASVAEQFKTQLEAFDAIGVISVSDYAWGIDYETAISASWDISRWGWIMDSNNPFNFIITLAQQIGLDQTAEYQTLKANIETAIDNRDTESFFAYLNQANSMILESGSYLPIYASVQ